GAVAVADPSCQSLPEKLQQARPGVPGRRGVVHLRTRVVEKGMLGSGIDVRLDVFPGLSDLLFQSANRGRWHALVILAKEPKHGRAHRLEIELHPRMNAVKIDG